jgi:hypothetical protein
MVFTTSTIAYWCMMARRVGCAGYRCSFLNVDIAAIPLRVWHQATCDVHALVKNGVARQPGRWFPPVQTVRCRTGCLYNVDCGECRNSTRQAKNFTTARHRCTAPSGRRQVVGCSSVPERDTLYINAFFSNQALKALDAKDAKDANDVAGAMDNRQSYRVPLS